MNPSIDDLVRAPLEVIRGFLPEYVASHVDAGPERLDPMRADLVRCLGSFDDAALERMKAAYRVAGDTYQMYHADPAARAITRTFMGWVVTEARVEGADALDRFLAGGPKRRLIVANHLSYTDTQVTDLVLSREGHGVVADRLVAIAGPKVYTDAWRRMAAIALNTRKTAQSNAVATEQAGLGVRELAAIAQETIADCARLMDEGWVVLLYPEGSRSRTGRMRPFLRAAARYLQLPGVEVLPLAQTGTERLFPIDDPLMHPGPVRLAFGAPFLPADYPGKTAALAEAHARIAAVLPEAYRPAEGEPPVA